MLTLPEEHRMLFKEPFGTLYRTMEEILPHIEGKIVYTVGDVVTHNLQKCGVVPAVAIVDGHTMRSPCRKMPELKGNCIRVKNPAGSITDDLIHALEKAVATSPVMILVEGEEDLAVIPLVIAAPLDSVILYGQPHEGVVLCKVTTGARHTADRLLGLFVRTDS